MNLLGNYAIVSWLIYAYCDSWALLTNLYLACIAELSSSFRKLISTALYYVLALWKTV
jgi:hypothetical protein